MNCAAVKECRRRRERRYISLVLLCRSVTTHHWDAYYSTPPAHLPIPPHLTSLHPSTCPTHSTCPPAPPHTTCPPTHPTPPAPPHSICPPAPPHSTRPPAPPHSIRPPAPPHSTHPPAGAAAVQGCSSFQADLTPNDTAPRAPQDWRPSLWSGQPHGGNSWSGQRH